MGVLEHDKDYFYNKQEYAAFRSVYEHPVEWAQQQKQPAARKGLLARGLHCLKTQGFAATVKLLLKKLK